MLTLTSDESRVLGTLIEKAQTTPAQYPLTLNALTVGCNQKNNRHPVTSLDEERVLDAVDALRTKGLIREAMLSGSRVAKYRHLTREVLAIGTPELVILAELLLRGPQSSGELRGNASRMHPLGSVEAVQEVLAALIGRDEPLVRELPPPTGSRAKRYAQLLSPTLHPLDQAHAGEEPTGSAAALAAPRAAAEAAEAAGSLAQRLTAVEADVERLRAAVRTLAERLGEPDPLA